MAFTFDATQSSATANSYVALEQADDYFNGRFGADGWFEYTEAQKQQLLVTATRDIDITTFGGMKSDEDQALEWPRNMLQDRQGRTIVGIPQKLIEATCELALWKWSEGDRMLSDTELQQVESFKAGPLDIKVKAGAMTFPAKVDQLLNAIGPGVVITSTSAKTSGPVRFSR